MEPVVLTDLIIWYVAFLFSVTAHEAAHAFAAMRGGDLTAYHGGQATLNPIPHIRRSPFGTVVVPVGMFLMSGFMIGWASAPYDPQWAVQHPRRAAWMAAAGPAANLLIFVASFIIIKLLLTAGILHTPERLSSYIDIVVADSGIWIGLAKFLSVLLLLNLILLIFNLFPFPPLDGSNVITLFMSEPLALKYREFMSQPMYSLLGIVIAWRLFSLIFSDIFRFVLGLLN